MHVLSLHIGPERAIRQVLGIMPGIRINTATGIAVRMQPCVGIRKPTVMISKVHGTSQAVALQISLTDNEVGLVFYLAKNRYHHCHQHGDNRDDDQ